MSILYDSSIERDMDYYSDCRLVEDIWICPSGEWEEIEGEYADYSEDDAAYREEFFHNIDHNSAEPIPEWLANLWLHGMLDLGYQKYEDELPDAAFEYPWDSWQTEYYDQIYADSYKDDYYNEYYEYPAYESYESWLWLTPYATDEYTDEYYDDVYSFDSYLAYESDGAYNYLDVGSILERIWWRYDNKGYLTQDEEDATELNMDHLCPHLPLILLCFSLLFLLISVFCCYFLKKITKRRKTGASEALINTAEDEQLGNYRPPSIVVVRKSLPVSTTAKPCVTFI